MLSAVPSYTVKEKRANKDYLKVEAEIYDIVTGCSMYHWNTFADGHQRAFLSVSSKGRLSTGPQSLATN